MCRVTSRSKLLHDMTHSKYAPVYYRVIGSLQNSVAFRKAFSCTRRDIMYKEEVYTIW